MPKKDGDITRDKILEVAEKLFSEKGFDGTSVSEIASFAKVNKATIYYHFKDKQDIVTSLFQNIMEEFDAQIEKTERGSKKNDSMMFKIKQEILFLETKKKILTVMMMESLKDNADNTLFDCAKATLNNEKHYTKIKNKKLIQASIIHEFFTGFMPLITFVIYREKWCKYFNCNEDTALDLFLETIERTHFNTHLNK
jgi:AcrR family transcriptional regulator